MSKSKLLGPWIAQESSSSPYERQKIPDIIHFWFKSGQIYKISNIMETMQQTCLKISQNVVQVDGNK